MEQVIGKDGMPLLVVHFALPDDVTRAEDMQLLFEPDHATNGFALVVKVVDADSALSQRCRVGLPFSVNEAGMRAKFRKKLRTLCLSSCQRRMTPRLQCRMEQILRIRTPI
jgi:hypothetical protein